MSNSLSYSSKKRRISSFACAYIDKNLPPLYKKDVIVLNTKHAPELTKLVSEESIQVFGMVDVHEVLYNAYMTLGVVNPEGEIVGVASFANNPNISAVPPWCWLQWMRNLFGCESITQLNSTWIQLLLWRPRFGPIFLDPILQYFFAKEKYKEHVVIAIPPGVKSIYFLGEKASRVNPKGYVNPKSCTTLGLMTKQNYMTYYKIRKAVEEDNDDLVPLIAKYSSRFHQMYGDYYIAELLTRFPESTRNIIVAEYEGFAVAVIITNNVVNYKILNENFELVCLNGLRKPHENDSIGSPDFEEDEFRVSIDEKVTYIPKMRQQESHLPPTQAIEEDDDRDIDDFWRLTDSTYELLSLLPTDETDNNGNSGSSTSIDEQKSVKDSSSEKTSISTFDEFESSLFKRSKREYKNPTAIGNEEKQRLQQIDHPSSKPIPNFYGDKNAFVLEVVAAETGHEQALELLIDASFESFPERNYCCISIPTIYPPVGFLERFVKVPPRSNSNFPHDLFVLHRNIIQPDLVVRMAITEDRPFVLEFLRQMHNLGNVLEMVKFALSTDNKIENSSNLCYIMTAYKQIVGLAVLSERIEVDYIMSHYAMYDWVDRKHQNLGSYAVIESLLIYPVFHTFGTFFLSQIHTLTEYSVIFYVITPEDMSKCKQRPICNLIQQFKPIIPRMVQDYSQKYLKGDFMPSDQITRLDTPFSLYLSVQRMSSLPRIKINARIVVVGSGDTASSFLETLICTPSADVHVTFTSVTVLSPHGLDRQKQPNKTRDTFFVHKGHFNHRPIHLTSLQAHLNFTSGLLGEIKRTDKKVITNCGTFLPYDILVLLVGEQYQAPSMTKGGYSETPANVFIVNTDTDAANALMQLAEIMDNDINPEGKVIVYGHDLRSHCALAALIRYGIPTDQLVFVDPINPTFDVENLISYDNLIYEDPNIERAIMKILRREGITLYQGFFNDWIRNVETEYVQLVRFQCAHRMISLPCKCIFVYTQKYISKNIFHAIVDSGLVFDGRLVIDEDFRTNDPNIYAAGPVTKYSRKYHADHLSHLYYNSDEVGEKIGINIRNMLIPEEYKPRRPEKPERFPLETKKHVLPTFTKPIVKLCTVVGGLNYLHITKPGKQTAAELEITRADFGKIYVTGDLKDLNKQGYFRIHINEFKVVEAITCLTKEEIYVNSLLQIWGKHVKMLNNLKLRFELMKIPDLLEFFKEPWTCAIYYDRFQAVREKIYRIILNTEMENRKSIAEIAYEYHLENNWKHLDRYQKAELLKIFNESPLRESIEDKIVEYIAKNSKELPMYAHPNLISNILHDYEKSPMFTE